MRIEVWKHMNAPIVFISVHKNRGGIPEVKRLTKMGTHPHHYKILSTYYFHSTSTDFCHIITTLQGI